MGRVGEYTDGPPEAGQGCAMSGYSAVRDNVKRRQEYERRHPSVSISHVEDPWEWVAAWYDQGIRSTLRDEELGGLLDQLDNLDLPAS